MISVGTEETLSPRATFWSPMVEMLRRLYEYENDALLMDRVMSSSRGDSLEFERIAHFHYSQDGILRISKSHCLLDPAPGRTSNRKRIGPRTPEGAAFPTTRFS